MKNQPRQIKLSWLDRFNKNYPKMLRFISELTLIVFSLMKTLLTTVGLPIILVLLVIVEINRVQSGISIFEESMTRASFGATVLVVLNMIIEFIIHHIENISNYKPEQPLRGSLRLFKRGMAYRMGVGKGWEAKEANPANAIIKMQNLLTFTIIAIALSGSMKDEIVAQGEVAWHSALVNILFSSSLATMTTWISGLLFTITAVLSAQVIAKYIAIQALQAESDMAVTAQKITNKERGIVVITGMQAKERYKALGELHYISEDDRLQLEPTIKFFDAKENRWTKSYKSSQTIYRIMGKINSQRERDALNGK